MLRETFQRIYSSNALSHARRRAHAERTQPGLRVCRRWWRNVQTIRIGGTLRYMQVEVKKNNRGTPLYQISHLVPNFPKYAILRLPPSKVEDLTR